MRTATYKGRTYRLDYLGNTRYGRRAKLSFLDGSRTFWVPASAVRENHTRAAAPIGAHPTERPASDHAPPPPHEDEFDVRRAEMEAERAAFEDEYRAEIEAGGDYGNPAF